MDVYRAMNGPIDLSWSSSPTKRQCKKPMNKATCHIHVAWVVLLKWKAKMLWLYYFLVMDKKKKKNSLGSSHSPGLISIPLSKDHSPNVKKQLFINLSLTRALLPNVRDCFSPGSLLMGGWSQITSMRTGPPQEELHNGLLWIPGLSQTREGAEVRRV
jgi:hypothetical protein